MKTFIEAAGYLAASFFILLLAQPDLSVPFCLIASALGYGLAFKALICLPSLKKRFCVATLFFALIQAMHLSWFTADAYVGAYIYPFLLILVLGLGAQFGLFSLFLVSPEKMTMRRLFALCGLWTILEWSRLFVLSGYPFNPVGLSLTASLYGMQLASLVGVFGLSFWVVMTNLFFYRGSTYLFIFALFFPYLFGLASVTYHDSRRAQKDLPSLSVLLVQTALRPEEKYPLEPSQTPLTPLAQWEHIFSLLAPYSKNSYDLILFSEAQVPYGREHLLFPQETARAVYAHYFGRRASFPDLTREWVGNSFFAKSIANTFNSDVIIGLEDKEQKNVYNAAFIYSPYSEKTERYEKRVLVPMGEYIPFAWCKKILSKYGIFDSYKRGKKAKVFKTRRASYGVSICYEEAFGHLMRENRSASATVLVNLTNDVWYPSSRLPMVHYLHGRMRAVESGVPLVRSCNSGVTCGVDSLGRQIAFVPHESSTQALTPSVCSLSLPTYTYKTLYTYLGDYLIITLSFLLILSFILYPSSFS